jgi:histone deacetylase 11
MLRIVYNPRYNIRACGVERLHPFDSCKYGRAMRRLRGALGPRLGELTIAPRRAVSTQELRAVHTATYLGKLHDAKYLAAALELPLVARLPAAFTRHAVLRPMRWACAGTILAGELALAHALAINMSGGYHHAKSDAGEGFCIYNDVALVVHHLRQSGRIGEGAKIAYVDLDAHQGNGVCHFFIQDRRVAIFDMFNRDIYPAYDRHAMARVDHAVPLERGCTTKKYLSLLQAHLPAFLDAATSGGDVAVLIYNAGTDVLAGDPLGGLSVSREGVVMRDAVVAAQASERRIPCIWLLSGGYTDESHAAIADSIASLAGGGSAA